MLMVLNQDIHKQKDFVIHGEKLILKVVSTNWQGKLVDWENGSEVGDAKKDPTGFLAKNKWVREGFS